MRKYIIALLLLLGLVGTGWAQSKSNAGGSLPAFKGIGSKGDAVNLNCLSFANQATNGDYVSFANNATTNQVYGCTTFAWKVWCMATSKGVNGNARVIAKNDTNRIGFDSENKLVVGMAFSGGTSTAAYATMNNPRFTYNVIHQIFAVYNEDGDKKIKLYLDGIRESTTDIAGNLNPADDTAFTWYIGNRSARTQTWAGRIYAVELFRNKAPSPTEVLISYLAGYKASKPISGGTEEFLFSEGSGSLLHDTIHNDIGTIVGATWVKDNLNKGGI